MKKKKKKATEFIVTEKENYKLRKILEADTIRQTDIEERVIKMYLRRTRNI